MRRREYHNHSSQINLSKQRLDMTAQLLPSIPKMGNIDAVFAWLSSAFVHYFGIQVVQFWRTLVAPAGQTYLQPQASASQDDSLPARVLANEQVATFVREIVNRQKTLAPESIDNLFSYHQADLCKRYGLYYCCGIYLNKNGFLPSKNGDLSSIGGRVPIEAVVILFFRQLPPTELQISVEYLLNLALQIAEKHGVLLTAADIPVNKAGYKLPLLQQPLTVALFELIPRRREDIDTMRSSSPLSEAIVISDKKARHLYRAIDGQKNVKELCALTHLELREMTLALQRLLAERHILLCNSSGQVVDSSLFFTSQ